MALANYSDIQATVASYLHRDDLTSQIQDFIRLAEADMQVRAKLSQWDTEATVTLTSGVGALPSDFAHAISVTYSTYVLENLNGAHFDGYALGAGAGTPVAWTIRGSNLVVSPTADGDVTLKYTARFTPLTSTATTNSLLTLFPDAYLHGALVHAASWEGDDANFQKNMALFEADLGRIRKYLLDYKYPHGLQMRVA